MTNLRTMRHFKVCLITVFILATMNECQGKDTIRSYRYTERTAKKIYREILPRQQQGYQEEDLYREYMLRNGSCVEYELTDNISAQHNIYMCAERCSVLKENCTGFQWLAAGGNYQYNRCKLKNSTLYDKCMKTIPAPTTATGQTYYKKSELERSFIKKKGTCNVADLLIKTLTGYSEYRCALICFTSDSCEGFTHQSGPITCRTYRTDFSNTCSPQFSQSPHDAIYFKRSGNERLPNTYWYFNSSTEQDNVISKTELSEPMTSITMMMWMKPEKLNDSYIASFRRKSDTGLYGMFLRLRQSKISVKINDKDSSDYGTSQQLQTAFQKGTWYFLVFQYTYKNGIHIYVDTTEVTDPITEELSQIENREHGIGGRYDGKLPCLLIGGLASYNGTTSTDSCGNGITYAFRGTIYNFQFSNEKLAVVTFNAVYNDARKPSTCIGMNSYCHSAIGCDLDDTELYTFRKSAATSQRNCTTPTTISTTTIAPSPNNQNQAPNQGSTSGSVQPSGSGSALIGVLYQGASNASSVTCNATFLTVTIGTSMYSSKNISMYVENYSSDSRCKGERQMGSQQGYVNILFSIPHMGCGTTHITQNDSYVSQTIILTEIFSEGVVFVTNDSLRFNAVCATASQPTVLTKEIAIAGYQSIPVNVSSGPSAANTDNVKISLLYNNGSDASQTALIGDSLWLTVSNEDQGKGARAYNCSALVSNGSASLIDSNGCTTLQRIVGSFQYAPNTGNLTQRAKLTAFYPQSGSGFSLQCFVEACSGPCASPTGCQV